MICATVIWENIREIVAAHQTQKGVHTWKLLQSVTSVLHRPGHHLPTVKLESITSIPYHHFTKNVSLLCSETSDADRSGTRNPHMHKVEEWARGAMMHSPHSSV